MFIKLEVFPSTKMKGGLDNLTRRELLSLSVLAGFGMLSEGADKKEKPSAAQKEPALTLEGYYNKAMQEMSRAWIPGLNMLTKIIDKYPVPEALFIYGDRALIKNNFMVACEHDHENIETAISAYNLVLQDRPTHLGALINRGACYSALGTARTYSVRYGMSALKPPQMWEEYRKKALEDFDKAIAIRPDSFAAHYGKAAVLEEMASVSLQVDLTYLNDAISEYQKTIKHAKKSQFWTEHTPIINEEAEVFIAQKPLCIMSPTVKFFMDRWFSKRTGGKPLVVQTDTMAYIPGENDFEAFANFQLGYALELSGKDRREEAVARYRRAVELNQQVPMFYKMLFQSLDGFGSKMESEAAGSKYHEVSKYIQSLLEVDAPKKRSD